MARSLKALPLALAVMALSIVTIRCGSTGLAQVRVIDAIPDAPSGLDVDFNSNKTITAMAFDTVNPTPATPAAYFGLTAGTNTIEAFYTGQTTNAILDTTNAVVNGGYPYTILLAGFANNSAAFVISDDNRPPTSGTVEIRVVNAAASSSQQYPGGFDVYILPPGKPIAGIPQISGLTLGQAGPGYITLNYLPAYTVWITPHNKTTSLFSPAVPQSASQITTLVIMDLAGGAGLSPNLMTLIDLQ
jgi:hypothetical protein